MTEPCIKNQKERPYKWTKFAWCSCGHNAIHHGFWGALFGKFTKSPCGDCVCDKFDYMGHYTYDSIGKVKICDDNDDE